MPVNTTDEQIAKLKKIAETAEQKPRGSYSAIFGYVEILRGKGFNWQEVVDECANAGIEVSKATLTSQYNSYVKKQREATESQSD